MTKPPNGTEPFDSSDLTQFKRNKRKPQRRKPKVFSVNPAIRAPPLPPFERKKLWRGGTAEKKAQIPGLDGPTSNYLTSTRARYRTSCLLVPGVGMLTYARRLACKNACEASPSKPNLFYPSSRYRHATFSLPINPALSVTASAGGRYFVYGQNYPLLATISSTGGAPKLRS